MDDLKLIDRVYDGVWIFSLREDSSLRGNPERIQKSCLRCRYESNCMPSGYKIFSHSWIEMNLTDIKVGKEVLICM